MVVLEVVDVPLRSVWPGSGNWNAPTADCTNTQTQCWINTSREYKCMLPVFVKTQKL